MRSFGLEVNPPGDSPLNWHDTATANDHGKAHSTIRQFCRDWSSEGSEETDLITAAILDDLSEYLYPPHTPSYGQRTGLILLPGAGLARLLLTLILHGYNATGNEISYHQLLASNWILNHIPPPSPTPTQYPLYPFCTTFTNLQTRDSQLARVMIPDIHPSTAITAASSAGKRIGEMNMVAGDFISVYSSSEQKDVFDAVVTVFFIDTAPNVIKYMEAVRNCLKPGGVWINIGPLLWHFDDRVSGHQERVANSGSKPRHSAEIEASLDSTSIPGTEQPGSIELSADEVIHLLPRLGFTVLPDDRNHMLVDLEANGGGMMPAELGYTSDPDSMLKSVYRCAHWVARKDGA